MKRLLHRVWNWQVSWWVTIVIYTIALSVVAAACIYVHSTMTLLP